MIFHITKDKNKRKKKKKVQENRSYNTDATNTNPLASPNMGPGNFELSVMSQP